jgi:hypothetical protein
MDPVLWSSQSPAPPPIPRSIINRLPHLDLNHGPVAKYFEHLADEKATNAGDVLMTADRVADAMDLNDELLDSLLVKLGLE